MNEFLMLSITAFWVGILSSISPCPLSTNLAMISFVTGKITNRALTLLSGLLYTLGRSITYIAVCFIVVYTVVDAPSISGFLQSYINQFIGIILVVIGMMLLDLIKLKPPRFSPGKKTRNVIGKLGIAGPLVLGIVFALALCPISAALLFGTVIPISIKAESAFFVPLLFGIGSAIPVILFAVLTAAGSKYVHKLFRDFAKIERYMRKLTGVIFLAIGIYYVIKFVFLA